MPTTLSQSANADRFDGRHWMLIPIERASQPPNPPAVPFRAQIVLSGVALIDFQGTSEPEWHREQFALDLGVDFGSALNLAPWPHPRGERWTLFQTEQWAVFATVNARFNANTAYNDGSAVDRFWLDRSRGPVVLVADVAVRDTDAWIYRIGYRVDLYGSMVPGEP
jgi:hypothetical protein